MQLLLREVLKFTDKATNTTEYSNLEIALAKVKESNDSINEKKRHDENIRKISEIQNSIVGEKLVLSSPPFPASTIRFLTLHYVQALFKPGRTFVREGTIEELDTGSKKVPNRQRGKGGAHRC